MKFWRSVYYLLGWTYPERYDKNQIDNKQRMINELKQQIELHKQYECRLKFDIVMMQLKKNGYTVKSGILLEKLNKRLNIILL